MTYSLGFIILAILIFLPGLVFRRLYFYSEFSKEFSAGIGLIELIARSSIPGVVLFIVCFSSYAWYNSDLQLNPIIERFKELIEFSQEKSQENGVSVTSPDLIQELISAMPFLAVLYLTSIVLGLAMGRIVRITELDTRIKLLRFKNFWFYLFNGYHGSLKKFKHLKKQPNEVFLLTTADILVESNDKMHLYSGAIVDYELSEKDGTSLKHVILEKAQRYSKKEGKTVKVDIPGDLFVLDCSAIKNINLTYLYSERKNKSGFKNSKWPERIRTALGFTYLLLFPAFLFETSFINWPVYNKLFEFNFFQRILSYFVFIEFLGLFDPYFYYKNLSGLSFRKSVFSKLSIVLVLLSIIFFSRIIDFFESLI